ncbi:acylphosphatase [Microvirga lotononidis]|uniref:Acylphosphatase n=1 Tax=Microvirga lotononidis TaxID=864069 RepID=I4YKN9_9HYPH|nr:acylphosphatase [Microvirga lotononidis]EIM24531.1 acylphosphatase [Microvirga lotononidis]WQO29865.1 acylphosphatase [Microvirga lotononidis]
MTAHRTAHVLIHGRVQGVSFRAWTQHQAQLHGLKGWVRNRRDGTVEAVFSGPEDLVKVMLKACHEGPGGSRVEKVEILDQGDPDHDFSSRFEIRETA